MNFLKQPRQNALHKTRENFLRPRRQNALYGPMTAEYNQFKAMADNAPIGAVGGPEGFMRPRERYGPSGSPTQRLLDMAAMMPGGPGDIAGPISDYRRLQNPEERTPANIALAGVGALPLVPSLLSMKALAVPAGLAAGAYLTGRATKGADYADTTTDAIRLAAGHGGIPPRAGLLDMTAYHGSPHNFDFFDMKKIGTGEGAQAYGHGLYFAENPKVAGQYQSFGDAKDLVVRKGDKIVARGGAVSDDLLEVSALMERGAQNAGEFKHNKAYYAKLAADSRFVPGDRLDRIKGLIDEYADAKFSYEHNPGALYTVDLPDEAIDKMLDWDAPLSEQPEAVKEALSKQLASEVGVPYEMAREQIDATMDTGGYWYKNESAVLAGAKPGDPIYQSRNDENMSKWLSAAGIPGIKYYDGGSRAAGKGTRNFVVFDENLPKILERNGEKLNALNP